MFLLHIALRFLLAPRICLIYCCKYTVAYYFHYHLPLHYSFQSLFKFPRIHSFLLHCLKSDLTFQGWGVDKFKILDNGKVSFSNPARQNLFTFQDCIENANKVDAAKRAME